MSPAAPADLSRHLWATRYRAAGADGAVDADLDATWWRVANALAAAEPRRRAGESALISAALDAIKARLRIRDLVVAARDRGLRVIDRCRFEVQFHLCNHLAGLSQQESRLLGGHPILGRIRRADLAGWGQIFADVEQVDQEDPLSTE